MVNILLGEKMRISKYDIYFYYGMNLKMFIDGMNFNDNFGGCFDDFVE